MLLYGLVGWQVATIYLVFGLAIAIVAGSSSAGWGSERSCRTGCARFESAGCVADLPEERLDAGRRLNGRPRSGSRDRRQGLDLGRCWASASAPLIHGYVPRGADGCGSWAADAWWTRAGRRGRGRAHVHQCRRRHPDRRGAARQGCGTRHGARLHDVGHRPQPARDDHPQAGADAPADRGLHRPWSPAASWPSASSSTRSSERI